MKPMSTLFLSWRCMGALCAALLIATPVHAAKDPNKQAIRRAQAEMKKISDEKAALEQEKVTLSQELDAQKKKSGELESSASRANKRKAALEKEVEARQQDKTKLSEQIEQLKKELAESQLALRDTRQNLQQETSEKKRLEQNLSARGKALEVCEANNQKLYQYHAELINRAQKRGSLDALLDRDPVLGLKRVEIENVLEEYRDKIEKEHIIKHDQ